MEGQRPSSPSAEGEIPDDTVRSGREVQQPGGLSDRGEPYQGVPRRTQSCKNAQTKPAPARRNANRFDSPARVFASFFNTANLTDPFIRRRGHQNLTVSHQATSDSFNSLTRFPLRKKQRRSHAGISANFRPRKPAGGLRAAFPLFLGCARGATSKISLSAESDQRRCLWNLPAF